MASEPVAPSMADRSPLTVKRQQRLSWPGPPPKCGEEGDAPWCSPKTPNLFGASPVATPLRSRRRLNPTALSPGLPLASPSVEVATESLAVETPSWRLALFSPIPKSRQNEANKVEQKEGSAVPTCSLAEEASWSWRQQPSAQTRRSLASNSPPWSWRRSAGGAAPAVVTATQPEPEAVTASIQADSPGADFIRRPSSARATAELWSWKREGGSFLPQIPEPRRLIFRSSPSRLSPSLKQLWEDKMPSDCIVGRDVEASETESRDVSDSDSSQSDGRMTASPITHRPPKAAEDLDRRSTQGSTSSEDGSEDEDHEEDCCYQLAFPVCPPLPAPSPSPTEGATPSIAQQLDAPVLLLPRSSTEMPSDPRRRPLDTEWAVQLADR